MTTRVPRRLLPGEGKRRLLKETAAPQVRISDEIRGVAFFVRSFPCPSVSAQGSGRQASGRGQEVAQVANLLKQKGLG